MKDSFIGVFKGGDIIIKDELTELQSVPHITHFFKRHSHRRYEPTYGSPSDYWTYTPINFDGTRGTISAGKFKIIDIGPEEGNRDFFGRIISIAENDGQEVHNWRSLTKGSKFIKEDLFPLIAKLSDLKSWEIFDELEQLQQSKKRINQLMELVNKRDKEIQELKREITNLKS